MATVDKSKRLPKKTVQSDKDAFANLKTIVGYAPTNKDFEVAKGTPLVNNVESKQEVEAQAAGALKTSRDNTKKSEWELHDYMLGSKAQVLAQYGPDSNECQLLGMKKKSERKRPQTKKNSNGAAN